MDKEVTKVFASDDGENVPDVEEETPAVPQVGPGSQLGSYQLEKLVARGMIGEIYSGRNLLVGKPCTVKVFLGELPLGPVEWGRYVHEGQLVSRLANPAIADRFYSGKSDGRYFTVMNTIAGEPLRGLVRQNAPLSRRFYLPILRALCGALAEVHAGGMFHGHFHGGQVLMRPGADERPEVSLLDFGVRHLIPGVKEPVSGWERKPEHAIYLAPEQAKGGPGDARSDVYAMCVLLYEMVTGKVPFLAGDFEQTLEQIANEAPVAPGKLAQIPEAVEETILRGMEKDPRGRLPSMEALYSALDPRGLTGQTGTDSHIIAGTGRHAVLVSEPTGEAALETDGALPPPVPLDDLEDEVAGGSRKKLFVVVALLVALLLGGGAAAFFLLGGEPEKPARPGPPPEPAARPAPTAAPEPTRPAKKARPPAKKRKRPTKVVRKAPAPAPRPAPAPAPQPEPPEPREEPKPSPYEAAKRALPERVRVHPAIAAGVIKKVDGWGSLRVLTGDRDGKVFVDGNLRGAGTVVLLEKVPAGKHRIIVEKGGIKLPHQDVNISADQRLDVSF